MTVCVEQSAVRPRVTLIGGGRHATVVADCIRCANLADLVGYTDLTGHDPSHMRRLEVSYLGEDGELAQLVESDNVTAGVLGIAGLQHRQRRRDLPARLHGVLSQWLTVVHPHACIADSAEIGEGTVVFAGATVNALARIGRHAVINTAAVVEHHCVVGDFAAVSPGATLCGCVGVGAGAFVGAGAVVTEGIVIGAESVVGAGAVVIHDVPECATVVGNPARVIDGLCGAGGESRSHGGGAGNAARLVSRE